jgi:beta-glucosidase
MTGSTPLFPYQDSTISVEQRVEDLLSRMELEDKAGLLFQPLGTIGALDDPGLFGMPSMRTLLNKRVNHANILMAGSAREIAEWNNAVQQEARRHPLGIPFSISSDPRHSFSNNPAAAMMAGPFTQFPEPMGLAAIGSVELVERFAQIIREEYLAVGIRTALHPQIDLASDPRWCRASATFGSDAELTARLGVAYIRGLQGDTVGPTSVSVMAKHFPGGGAQKDGEDPHFAYGREQVYPGGQFDLHLEPFKAAIAAGVSQLMPYYGMPVGTEYEEVGFGFNKGIITDLLREQLGYDGIVCTDWGILTNTCWGVEHLSVEERMLKALDAGIDQFGGEFKTDVLIKLVRDGSVTEDRIDVSVRRLLREKFRLGLFDNPFVDADQADSLVGGAGPRAEGIAAQAASQTLLKNAEDGPARLPLKPSASLRLYVEGIDAAAIGDRAVVVDSPELADVAVLRLSAPWEQRGNPGEIESFFHAGSLAFPEAEIVRVTEIGKTVPTVVDICLERPAILADIEGATASLIANYGSSDEAFLKVLFGELEPLGRLPFEIPSSMAAVEANLPDVPNDTENPTYPHGFGLRY